MFSSTFLGTFLKNSVQLGRSLFKDTTVMASDAVVSLSDRIMDETDQSNDLGRDAVRYLNKINDEIFASIVGRFMVNDMGVTEDVLNEMLYGKNSMVVRLNTLKKQS